MLVGEVDPLLLGMLRGGDKDELGAFVVEEVGRIQRRVLG
jgi:hypothetical protein